MDAPKRRYLHNIPAARELRRPQTRTESLLWEALRDRRLGGLKFRRQHAVRRFVVDFYCHELRLALEVDGGVHESPEQQEADGVRQAELEEGGLRFLRVSAHDVESALAVVLERLEVEIAVLSGPHPAAPSPHSCVAGEGEFEPGALLAPLSREERIGRGVGGEGRKR